MKCCECDAGTLTRSLTAVEGQVKKKKYTVQAWGLVCDHCGHVAMEGADVQDFMRKLADAYRLQHKLLTSSEIKAIRGGLSQLRFAEKLGVGIASVKRWELGLVQDLSNDKLLRDFARHTSPTWMYETAASSQSQRLAEVADLWALAHGPPGAAQALSLSKSCHNRHDLGAS